MEIGQGEPGAAVVAPPPAVTVQAGDAGPEALRTGLLEAFAEDDVAVVCDLRGRPAGEVRRGGEGRAVAGRAGAGRADELLDVADAVAQHVSRWPAALLVVVTGPDEELLRAARHRAGATLAVAPDHARAAQLAAARPPVTRARRPLEPRLQAPAIARAFLRDTLPAWGAADHLDDALVVADELVANAVVHAGTEAELRLALLGRCLGIAVADRSSRPPALGHPGGGAESGRGLLLVDALSDSWHVLPRRGGGKVVRAVLGPAAAPAPPTPAR